ncbi:MAG: MerR family transcriptional regulator, partial [Halocynthiibacter sp.]
MDKSPDAFRTIREVAEWLETPAHVLRFWESKFNQVKPVKRAGGRRYYRSRDMLLLGGIKKLLHSDGMTIKGVQKMLQTDGIKSVAALSQPLEADLQGEIIEATAFVPLSDAPEILPDTPEPELPGIAAGFAAETGTET